MIVHAPWREKKTWTVVWCDDRCRREVFQAQRAQISHHATKHGAKPCLKKKASQFAEWVPRVKTPYALLTTWRELKPCIDAVTCDAKPMFIVVFCVDEAQMAKASRWARRTQRGGAPIFVLGDVSDQEGHVSYLISQAAQTLHSQGLGKDKYMRTAYTSLRETQTQQQHRQQQDLNLNTQRKQGPTMEHEQPDLHRHGDGLINKTHVQPMSELVLMDPVKTHMMQIWATFPSPVKVSDALKAAVPDVYED